MRRLTLAALCVLVALPASSQDFPFSLHVPFPEITSFDDTVPTHEEVLGHDIGSKHTFPHEVVEYFRAVAAVSDRVTLHEHARTYEGRPLIHAIVTSPENHARLDAIREANLRLSSAPSEVTAVDLGGMPVVAYQGYSIHGDEASGTEAALLYLYYLAAGEGSWIEEALDAAVLIVDPMFNPDGRDRFTDWANRNRGAVPTMDPADREHGQPWPRGRTNHYWFDLNRDWLPAQHPESQGRMTVFHSWRPQVLTDHHEMGGNSSFFFMPGIPSRNNPNTPEGTIELTHALAEHHAEALDAIGSAYYSEESFDDFYYGKGSTFPDINGAVGILFEQASSRSLLAETVNGSMPYSFTVRNHFVTSISTLKGIIANREALLENHHAFYAAVPEFVEDSRVKGYVVSLESGRTRAHMMARLLARHDVQAYDLARDITVGGTEFLAGSAYVLPLAQRQGRLLEAAFETTRTFEDSLFYDVSTWTFPLSHDLTYAELTSDPSSLLGDAYTQSGPTPGKVVGGRAGFAYLIPWDQHYAARAAYRFQRRGIATTVLRQPFSASVGGPLVDFDRGTLVVPIVGRSFAGSGETGPDVHALVREAAEKDFITAYAVDTGLTPTGPDLGAASRAVLEKPKVALLTGSGTSAYNAGEVWHLLSELYHMPVSLLDVDRVAGADLARYNTIILAGGGYAGLDVDQISAWVRDGGRLILQDSAVSWGVRNELLDLTEKEFDMSALLEGVAYDQLSATQGAQQIGGAILALNLDQTHPLAYGLPVTLPVFRQGNRFYEAPGDARQSVGVYADEGILSGYISEKKLEDLSGSAGVVVGRLGGGTITAFMDRLYFRAFWHGSSRLLMNAIFLGGTY